MLILRRKRSKKLGKEMVRKNGDKEGREEKDKQRSRKIGKEQVKESIIILEYSS